MSRMPVWILVAALVPSGVAGQIVTADGSVQTYTMSDASEVVLHDVSLSSASIQAVVPLRAWAIASMESGWGRATMTLPNGDRAVVDGVIDSRIALGLALRDDLTFTGFGLLPTGEMARDLDEARIVGVLSADLLPFAMSQWGSGGGFGGDLAYTGGSGGFSLTVSAGALFLSGSSPLGYDQAAYEPGSQLRARGSLDAAVGESGVLSVLIGVQRFSPDVHRSESLYRAGLGVEGVVSYAVAIGPRESVFAYGGAYRLGPGSLVEEPDFLEEFVGIPGASDRSSRLVLAAGGELRVSRGRLDLVPRADLRVLRRGDGRSQGWVGSGGVRSVIPLPGRAFSLEPRLGVRIGSLVVAEGVRSGLVGWEAGMGLRWVAGR